MGFLHLFDHEMKVHFTVPSAIHLKSASGSRIDYKEVNLSLNPHQVFIISIALSVVLLTFLLGIFYCIFRKCQSRQNPSIRLKGKSRKALQYSKGNKRRLGCCSFLYQLLTFRWGVVDENYNYESIAHSLDEEELDFKRQLEEQCEYEFGDLDSEEEELDDEFSLEGYDYQESKSSSKGQTKLSFIRERKDRYRQINTVEEEEDEDEEAGLGAAVLTSNRGDRYDRYYNKEAIPEDAEDREGKNEDIEEMEEEQKQQRSLDRLFNYDAMNKKYKMVKENVAGNDYAIEMTHCDSSTVEMDDNFPAKTTTTSSSPEEKLNKSVKIHITEVEDEQECKAGGDSDKAPEPEQMSQKAEFSFPRPRTSTIISSRITAKNVKSPSSRIES